MSICNVGFYSLRATLRGRIGKSDEVRTTDSVIIHLIWPIEELDIRSMSL